MGERETDGICGMDVYVCFCVVWDEDDICLLYIFTSIYIHIYICIYYICFLYL